MKVIGSRRARPVPSGCGRGDGLPWVPLIVACVAAAPATAADIPDRPEPAPRVAGECPAAFDVEDGDTVGCRGVVLPRSMATDYLNASTHLDRIEGDYRITSARYEHDIEVLQWQADYIAEELARCRTPLPFWTRPGTQIAVGVLGGVSLTVAAGWSPSLVQ